MELQVKNRTILGKKTKSLRKKGIVPAEIFGKNFPNQHISVSEKDFEKMYKKAGESTMIELVSEDFPRSPEATGIPAKGLGTKNKTSVLISDVIRHPITQRVLAVDFRHVTMDEKIRAKVPVILSGTAPATKNGLMIIHVLKEIEVEALPNNIPHRFEADLSTLEEEGQSIHVSNLAIPKTVKIFVSPETVIATVGKKAREEVAPQPTASAATETATTETQTPSEPSAEKKAAS